VSHLVRADLTYASEYERRVSSCRVRAEQSGVDVVIRSGAVRIQTRHAFDDLARARVAKRASDRPAALVAILPLDDVVASVHGVHALGQILDPEATLESGAVECVDPPADALFRRGSERLRNSAVDVVDEWVPDRTARIRGIHALEPMARDPALLERLLNGLRVVLENDAGEPDPRVERARFVAGIGKR